MDENEEYEQKITLALQQVDLNFVKALKSASLVLKQVKLLERSTVEASQCLETWSSFFALFGSTPQPETTNEKHSSADVDAVEGSLKKLNMSSMSTPSMPCFSKSFAKTPMARNMNGCFSDAEYSADKSSILSSAFKTMSPPISTPFYKPSKTPGPDVYGDETPLATPDVNSPPISTPFLQSRALAEGFNTPGTPPTPLDGDYGPVSAAKSGVLRFTTPMLLSSGTREATERRLRNRKVQNKENDVMSAMKTKLYSPTDLTNSDKLNDSTSKKPQRASKQHSTIKRTSRGTPLSVRLANELMPRSAGIVAEDGDDCDEELLKELLDAVDEEAPEFNVNLFPIMFRSGEGAAQITSVYSQFQSSSEALSLDLLDKALPLEQPQIQILLELLTSRRLIEPFSCQSELFWRKVE